MTSYADNTLATTAKAMLLQEIRANLLPKTNKFCTNEKPRSLAEATMCSKFQAKAVSDETIEEMVGCIQVKAIDTLHERHQAVNFSSNFETKYKLTNKVEIFICEPAKGHRLCVGYGKTLFCFYDNYLAVYNLDGLSPYKQLNIGQGFIETWSAAFIGNSLVVVALTDGLFLVDIETSAVVTRINNNHHAEVFYNNDTIYALNVTKKCADIIRKPADEWIVTYAIPLQIEEIHPSVTMVVTPSCVYICNYNNDVYQYSFNGALLQTIRINEHEPAHDKRFICAVDVDGRMALSVGGQLVIQHNDDSRVVKLEGVKRFQDIAFEDRHALWVLENVSVDTGQKRLIKYQLKH